MRDSLAYVATFLFAFILVTASLFIMNEKYNNMFRMDFSPRIGEAGLVDSLRKMHDSLAKKVNIDSVAKVRQDSLQALAPAVDSAALKAALPATDAHGAAKGEAFDPKKANSKQLVENKPADAKPLRLNDSTYIKWKKQTLGIFETMDSKQIARLIVGYSDDVARDLIYSMKKKKAGEVLSLLTPEMFHRITRVQ